MHAVPHYKMSIRFMRSVSFLNKFAITITVIHCNTIEPDLYLQLVCLKHLESLLQCIEETCRRRLFLEDEHGVETMRRDAIC